ncbi:MAG TPA: universal stress protein [Vicinamibacteria bacterium]|jgi:nucleotide-binding universal stress UspA family protein
MYEKIMVPLDGSSFAEEALPLAHLLARTLKAELHLVHVVSPSPDFALKSPEEDLAWTEFARGKTAAYLDAHAERAKAAGAPALSAVLEGHVSAALESYAESQKVDLTILTTHGRSGASRWWIGSVTDELLRSSGADLLLVRPWDETDDRTRRTSRFGKILVPLDGSKVAETALSPATRIADAFRSELVLARVVPSPVELTSIYGVPGVELRGEAYDARIDEAKSYLHAVVGRLERRTAESLVIESGGAAEGIVEAARAGEVDLIAMASHGRGGLERALLGSVADKVLRATTRPVLVVRPR